MIFKTTLNSLKELFKREDSNQKYITNMKKVLVKLKDKAEKLQIQLENENNESKRKEINLMLKVIYKKQNKGEKLIAERESYLSSSN